MGADLYLNSVWHSWWAESRERILAGPDCDAISEMVASGGYFRNSYNTGDVMWATGLSWPETVGGMLDSEGYLAVERVLAMIEARPLTKERLGQHYFDCIAHGVEEHPITGWLFRSLGGLPTVPPDFETFAAFLRQRRTELIALLEKSVALNEPLLCSV